MSGKSLWHGCAEARGMAAGDAPHRMEFDQVEPVTTIDAQTRDFRPDPAALPAEASDGPVEQAFRRATRHSRAVKTLKVLLPALAVLIALVFTAYSYLLTPGQVAIDILETSYSNGKLTMAHPKLDGFTKENRPYSMRAARAVQDVTKTSVFELDDIQAKLPLSDANWANVVAAKGIYDKDKNTLTIPTAMTVTTTDGMVAKLNSAFVNVGTGELNTSDPVDITLQGSHLTADKMTVVDRGKVLVFDEKVRLTMMPQKKKAAVHADGATDAPH
jgi:lipopolysaccharide export system protein LptC